MKGKKESQGEGANTHLHLLWKKTSEPWTSLSQEGIATGYNSTAKLRQANEKFPIQE